MLPQAERLRFDFRPVENIRSKSQDAIANSDLQSSEILHHGGTPELRWQSSILYSSLTIQAQRLKPAWCCQHSRSKNLLVAAEKEAVYGKGQPLPELGLELGCCE